MSDRYPPTPEKDTGHSGEIGGYQDSGNPTNQQTNAGEQIDSSHDSLRQLIKILAVSGAVVGLASYALVSGCRGDDDKVKEPPTTTAVAAPTFAEIVASTQPKPTERPRVLTNFDLSTLLDKDYPTGSNTVETVTVSARGCVLPNKKVKKSPIKSTSVVFRNGSAVDGFSPAYLVSEHIEKAEELRLNGQKLIKEQARLKPELSPLSIRREAQILEAFNKRLCPKGSLSLLTPIVTSRQTIIEPQAFSDERSLFGNDTRLNKKDTALLIFLGAVLVTFLYMDNRPKKDEQNGH